MTSVDRDLSVVLNLFSPLQIFGTEKPVDGMLQKVWSFEIMFSEKYFSYRRECLEDYRLPYLGRESGKKLNPMD
jgi:hypothetical protein